MQTNFQLLQSKDLTSVADFLATQNLPVSDLSQDHLEIFCLYHEGELVATIGLENHGSTGLLRSLAVKDSYRNQKIAERMIDHLLEVCESKNIKELFLLTTTAEEYFKRKGFQTITREKVPQAIRRTSEFRSVCPSSAVVMHLPLD